jgi:choline dehydrogenase-like flavoprotein
LCLGRVKNGGGGRRASAARTYLHLALKWPNLQLVTKALVHRVIFDGKRAVGVEFSRGGPGSNSVERAEAAREVILSAGAIGSPAHPATVGCRRSRAPRPHRRTRRA